MNKKVGLMAYGEMGEPAFRALIKEFKIQWVILPSQNLQTETEKLTEKLVKKNKIKVVHYTSLDNFYNFVRSDTPDIVVISSFNKIIPGKIINLTKFMNVHLGDLPRYKGRANVNWAIINGRTEIGVTIHKVIPDLDSGNIYNQKLIKILSEDTVKTVFDKINGHLIKNLSHHVTEVLEGYGGIPQKGKATYCCTRLPEDGMINWSTKTIDIYNFIRALTKPYPGAFTYFEGKKMIVWEAEVPRTPKIYEGTIPGRIGSIINGEGVEVLTGDSSIVIKKIEYLEKESNASDVIKSVKKTLGINWPEIYEKINKD